MLRPLAGRDFRRVWLGESANVVGSGVHLVVVAVLVLRITGSSAALGLVLLVSGLARAVLMIVGGVLTDRISPRLVVLASYVCRGVVVGVICLLAWTSALEVWHIFVGRFAFALADAVYYPAVSALVTRTVTDDDLARANSLHRTVLSAGTVGGPGLAGVLLALTGDTASLAVAALCFLVAALLLVPVREKPVAHQEDTDRAGFVRSAVAGLRYTLRTPGLKATLGLLVLLNLALVGPVNVGLPVLAAVRLGEPALVGGLFAALGAGSLVGGVLAGVLGTPRRPGTWLCLMAAANGGVVMVLSVSGRAWLALVAAGLIGVSAAVVNVVAPVVMQSTADPAYLGRVMSWYWLSEFGMAPLSNVLVGVMVDMSVTVTFVVTGGFAVVVALAATVVPAVRGLRVGAPPEPAPAT